MAKPLIHNYTKDASRWGWDIVRFDFLAESTVRVSAFGLKKFVVDGSTVEAPIQPGEFMAVSMPDGTALYEIIRIAYRQSPDDLYEADMTYVQHLTGIRMTGGAFDGVKRVLASAWRKVTQASEPSEKMADTSFKPKW